MKNIFLLLFLCLSTTTFSFSQVGYPPRISINLSKNNTFNETIGGFAAATTRRNEKEYKFDQTGFVKFMVKRFRFDVSNVNDYKDLQPDDTFKDYVDILIAKTGRDSTVFIVDKNRNRSFLDEEKIVTKTDPTYRFKSADYPKFKTSLETTISYEHIGNGNVDRATFPVMLFPFRYGFSYNDPLENELYFMIYSNEHSEGNFNLSGKNYRVIVSKGEVGPFYLSGKTRFYFGDSKRMDESEYKLKSMVTIGNANYSIDSINRAGTFMTLSLEAGTKIIGNKVNQYLPENYLTEQLKNKDFLILQFWGTWCVPCVEQLPVLKSFYDRNKGRKTDLLGIDFESTIPQRNKIAAEKGINWPLIQNETAEHDYVKFLNVTSFPTFFVINKERKIVFKDTEINSLILFMKSSEVLNSK